jgi:predicted ATPase
LGLVQLKAGEFQAALKTFDEALAVARSGEAAFWQGEIYRLKGEACLLLNPAKLNEAEEFFQQAVALNQARPLKPLELSAAVSLARLWQVQGRPAEAYNLLAPLYRQFSEGFDHPDLQAASALLEDIISRREPQSGQSEN